jgi:hypothetical protein
MSTLFDGALASPQPALPPVETVPPAATTRPAPIARRLAAGLVDGLLLLVGVAFLLGFGLAIAGERETKWVLVGWVVLFAPLYFGLYHAFGAGTTGAGGTPGQVELRIGLHREGSEDPPGPAHSLARAYLGLAFLLLVLPALADLAALLTTGRSLRDRLTRTNVAPIALAGNVPELAQPTIAELLELFEPTVDTHNYLGRGWALLRTRPRLLLGSVASVYGILVALGLVLWFLLAADSPHALAAAGFFFVALGLLVSGAYWVQAVIVLAVEEARAGGDASVRRTLRRAIRRVNALSAALALLLVPVALVAATFTWVLVLPLLALARFSLVAPALVLEDRRVLGAFLRSWQLTAGRSWRTLGLLLLSLLLIAAPPAVVQAVLGAAGPNAVAVDLIGLALSALVLVVVLTWLGAAWSLFYEDARRCLPPREER